MMDLDRFWGLIEEARQKILASVGDQGYPELSDEDALAEVLSTLEPEEIIQFDARLGERMNAAYHWDLWAALFVIEGGAGDDSFEHFRAELVLLGREVFERALADADSLADVSPVPVGIEGLIYVPGDVYEQKTGQSFYELESDAPPYPDHPAGEPWVEEDLPRRLPRLWAEFGDWTPSGGEEATQAAPSATPGGPRIRVVEGHFQGHEGELTAMGDEDQVTVLLTLFGRPTSVQLRRSQIEMLDWPAPPG